MPVEEIGPLIRDIVTGILVLASALLCFAAAVGLLRFRDVLARLHAATKPQILGVALITVDVAVANFSLATLTMAIAIIGFQTLTSPLSAHMLGRAAYRTEHFRSDLLVTDELRDQDSISGAPPSPPHGGTPD